MVKTAHPTRADYYKALAATLPPEALVVTCLGNASYLWAALHHAPENFYFEDAMGLALPLALGLAVAQPKRPVIAVEGDGALLMHMGALVTIGAVNPPNLTMLLIQNGVHAASGGQALTNAGLDLAALARASGIARAENLAKPEALGAKMRASSKRDGAEFLVLATEPDIEVVHPPVALDPIMTKQRFMAAIGAPRYIPTLFGGGKLEGM
ncbi:thiamine pyrophosphate-dependent enzyme [Bradyrhizobium sp. NP1]|uniref:thiamine pyrophosphate-dependent enzyme n=1 Tax=Bradyrhizobium sp. NP1 TaxID=3049772 RepID=UPI0025A5684F|nr:thiamine pyrophosphate-dependent enzyme [Bradyrhizobium sp. NP1]WJR80396.1 thiamine pyrophosphate-dependent enzyme [Bradyrhizobium sp. NP1]